MVCNKIRLFVSTTCKHARVFTIYIAAAVDVLFIYAADDIYKMLIRDMVSFVIKMSRYLYKDQGMINNLSTLCTVKYLFR